MIALEKKLGASALALAILPFVASFSVWTASSGWAWIRFLLAIAMLAYLPGRFVLARLGIRAHGLDGALLSSILGLISTGVVAWVCLRVGLGASWLVWPLATLVWSFGARAREEMGWPRGRPIHLALSGVFLLVCLPFAITRVHYRNLVKLDSGGLRDFAFDDATLHISIANELGRSVPPEVPFLPGSPLAYHYGPDFLVRILADAAHLSTIDLTLRFMPTLYMSLLVIAVFCCARRWLGREWASLLAVVVVLLGDDFSYLPGMLIGSNEAWGAYLLRVPTTPSLYMVNPMLPGLALLFATLLALSRQIETNETKGRFGWGLVASILLASLMFVKVFSGAQLLGCLALAGLYRSGWRRDHTLLRVLALALVFSMPALVPLLHGDDGLFAIRFHPSGMLTQTLVRTGLAETPVGRHAIGFERHPGFDLDALWYFAAALPAFLVAAFGARSLGLIRLARRGWIREVLDDPIRLILWAFVLSGPVASLFFSIRPIDFPRAYDNAVWFFVQSKFVAWIFAVEALLFLTRHRSTLGRGVAIAVFLLASLPTGLQYIDRTRAGASVGGERILDVEHLEMLDWVNEAGSPGEVVFAQPELATTILTNTDKRSPVLHLYTDSFVRRDELGARAVDQRSFWTAWRGGRISWDVVERRGAKWVVVRRTDAHPHRAPAFENERFAVYDLRRE